MSVCLSLSLYPSVFQYLSMGWPKVHLGFSVTPYGKTQMSLLANTISFYLSMYLYVAAYLSIYK